MGENGRQFVLEHFQESSVSIKLVSEYRRLIANMNGVKAEAQSKS
jgi:hypothetical protein